MSLESKIDRLADSIDKLIARLAEPEPDQISKKEVRPADFNPPKSTSTAKKKTEKKPDILTVDAVRAKLVELKNKGGKPVDVLKSVQAAKLSEVLPAKYPAVMSTAQTMIEALDA